MGKINDESRIGVMKDSVDDARAGKIIFVSHCTLNQNAKVRGIAKFPAAIKPLVDLLLGNDIAIFQMRCPEMEYFGSMRWGQVKPQYATPMFRKHCRELANEVLDQVEDYRRGGYDVLGFVMMDGSPVCGLNRTPVPAVKDQKWGGMVWYTPRQRFDPDRGVFCEELQAEAEKRGITDIPYLSFPEADEVGTTFDEALADFKNTLNL